MEKLSPTDPRHIRRRKVLRVGGPIILALGVLCVVSGIFVLTSNDDMQFPWLMFIGMPMIFTGAVMTLLGFMGSMMRYQANEVMPVGVDSTNYFAEGAKPGVRTMAHAAAQGVVEGLAESGEASFCQQCGTRNDSDAKFCKSCGRAM